MERAAIASVLFACYLLHAVHATIALPEVVATTANGALAPVNGQSRRALTQSVRRPGSSAASTGAQVDLKSWSLTMPDGSVVTLPQAQADKRKAPAAQFTSEALTLTTQTSGCKKTRTSNFCRSELRELSSNGKNVVWRKGDGGLHTLQVKMAVTKLPTRIPSLVVAQIHDSGNGFLLVRVRADKLIPSRYNVVATYNKREFPVLHNDYRLGTSFELRISVVGDGSTTITYHNVAQAKHSVTRCAGLPNPKKCFFKAGAYSQSNEPGSFAEVKIFSLTVVHNPELPPMPEKGKK